MRTGVLRLSDTSLSVRCISIDGVRSSFPYWWSRWFVLLYNPDALRDVVAKAGYKASA